MSKAAVIRLANGSEAAFTTAPNVSGLIDVYHGAVANKIRKLNHIGRRVYMLWNNNRGNAIAVWSIGVKSFKFCDKWRRGAKLTICCA